MLTIAYVLLSGRGKGHKLVHFYCGRRCGVLKVYRC